MGRQNKGKQLFRCGECQAARFVHWTELNRAARLRCAGCGSARMEVSKMGGETRAEIAGLAAEAVANAEKHGTGSLIPH